MIRRLFRIRERAAGRQAARDVADEIEFHIASRVDDLMAQGGLTRAAAEARARREFGDRAALRRELRQDAVRTERRLRAAEFLDGVFRDLRYAVRALRARPLFTGTSGLTLALGVGATATMFAVVHGVLLKPLPYHEPHRLVSVYHRAPGLRREGLNQTAATYFTYREEQRAFDGIGLWDHAWLSVTGLREPEEVAAIAVTRETLPLLGASPLLGRLFSAEDDAPAAAPTVVLTHGYWQRRLGADRDAVGRVLTVQGQPAEIIGVLPPGLRFLNERPALFVPLRLDRAAIRGVYGWSYQAIARLRPGVTIEQAGADVDRMIPLIFEKFPGGYGVSLGELETMGFGANVSPLEREVVGDVGRVLWLLFGCVGVVLLIACANVANLFLVRAQDRIPEVAVRSALGGGRLQIARQLLLETVVLSIASGIAAVGLAYAGIRLLVSLGPAGLPRLDEVAVSPVVLAFALGISLVAGVAFGLYPLLRLRRLDLVASLKETGRGGAGGSVRQRMRSALVVSQLALALLLLVGAGLMIRSFAELLAVHPGFERPGDVLTMRITVPDALAPTDPEAASVHERILRRIERIPGVTSAALSSSVTMDGWDDNNALYIEGAPVAEDEVPPVHQVKYVSQGYFRTMGNPVIAGRDITWADIHNRHRVAMVTANLARVHWATPEGAVGNRISTNWRGPWFEIIGVVGDEHDDGVDREATPIVYWPMVIADRSGDGVRVERSLGYAIRSTRVRDQSFLPELQRAVWSVHPDLPLAKVRTLEQLLARSRSRAAFMVIALSIAAVVAVVLGVVGVYGVIAYAVAHRTREIGVRIAFGATRGEVRRLVLRHGARLVAIGIAVGLAGAAAVTRLMAALLFGVSPVDPLTYGIVAVGLAAVALIASWLPARRAASVDPVQALRGQ